MKQGQITPKVLSEIGDQQPNEQLGGWQALALPGPVYVVEGTSDCWRIGPGALGHFGKSLSTTQKLLLIRHFAGRPIIILLDRDARQDAEQIQRQLTLARSGLPGDNRVVIAELPPQRDDPADCTREEIIDAAQRALLPMQGIASPLTSTQQPI